MAELKDFRIFSDLKDKELAKLQESVRSISYGRGEIIFQEGAPAFGFYLIFEGMVKLVKRSMRAKSQILKIAGPGEILGETTLFDKGSHNAYAKTIDSVVVGFIERGDFFYFLERHPKTIFRLYAKLDFQWKKFSGLTDDKLNQLKELDVSALALGTPHYQELVLLFLPEEQKRFLDTLDQFKNKLGKSVPVHVGRLEDFDRFFEAMVKIKKLRGVHNSALALRGLAELALKVLEAEKSFTLDLQDSDAAAVCTTDDGYGYVIMPLARDR